MSTRRLAPLLATLVVGVLVVAAAASGAASGAATSAAADPEVLPSGTMDGDEDPTEVVAALVMTEARLLTEIRAFPDPLPPALAQLRDGWTIPADQLEDPLATLAAVEGLSIGMAPELAAAGVEVPEELARVLDTLDEATWAALDQGRVGVMPADDHDVALVIVVDLMGLTLEEAIADLRGVAPPEPAGPMPPWMTVAGVALLLAGVAIAVRLVLARRGSAVEDWLRELSAPVELVGVERTAIELVRDLLPGTHVQLAQPDDDDGLVAAATALGSSTRRRRRLAIPAVGNGRIRRVLVLDPAPARRDTDDLHELASLIGPAIARAEDHQALVDRDPLTDVFNRRRLDRDLGHLDGDDVPGTSLLMVDVDHFKDWNDAHGHHAGDVALQRVAATICAAVRPGDVVYRYGGEEFTVLLPRTRSVDATAVAERIRRAVASTPVTVQDEELGILTVSVGLADTGNGPSSTLTERADGALYEAKRTGRDKVVVAGSAG